MALVLLDIADVRTFIGSNDQGSFAPIDVVTGRVFTSQSSITRHPVESGADVADHVIDEPDTIELRGVISNTPAHTFNTVAAEGTRAEDYWEELLAAKRSNALLQIISGPFVLEDMMLRSLTRTDDATSGDAVHVAIRAEQVTTVESASVDAPTRDESVQKKKQSQGKKPKKEATSAQSGSFASKLAGI